MKRKAKKELQEKPKRVKKESAGAKENIKENTIPSEEFYHTLFNASPSGILLEDATGVIIKANPAFCSLLGYAEEELIGRKVHFLASPKKRHRVDVNIKRIMSGEILQFVEQSVKKDGSICYIQLNEQRITLPDGKPGIISLAQDMTKQVLAERALKESDIRYHNLFEFAPYPIIIHSNGKIVDLNHAALQFSEASDRAVILGKPVMSFVHPDFRELAAQRIQKLISQGSAQDFIEEKFITTKGNARDVEVGVVPFLYEGNPAAQVVFRDITQKKEINKQIKKNEERYRELVTRLPFPIIVHSKGIVRFVNPAAKRMFGGQSDTAFIGRKMLDFIHPDYKKEAQKSIRTIYKSDVSSGILSQKLIRIDGSAFDVELIANHTEFEGQPASLVSFSDVSMRVKAEEALRESETKFRIIVENSHAGITLIDSIYRFIYVNPQFAELTGYTRDELIGQDFRLVLDEESKKLVADRYRRRQRGENVPTQYEFNVLSNDGALRRVEIRSSIIKDQDGNSVTIAQILDITDRKEAEEALLESEEKYRSLAETATDLILIHTLNGTIVYANKSAMEVSGFGTALIDMNIAELVPEKFRSELIVRSSRRLLNKP